MSGTDIVQIYCAPMVTLNLIYAGEVALEGVVFRMRSKEMYTGISLTNIIWQKDMEIHIVKSKIKSWNKFKSLNLFSWLVIRSFRDATDYCRTNETCRGITEENGFFYTHLTAQVYGSSNITSWRKGILWADNFVPRVSWGAISPQPGLTGNMDPRKMVGIMGHHTAGVQCFTQTECKSKMRDFQLEDMLTYDMR